MTRHVLIIEDDTDIRESVAELLELSGFVVTQAEQGGAALEHLRGAAELPDLIFLDLMMPVMDGYAFRRAQREDPRLAAIPVVVMSADPQLERRADELLARRYIRKPFDIAQLLAAAAT